MLFKYHFILDRRRKLANGKFPIKVDLYSYSDERNYNFKIPPLISDNERIEFSSTDQKEFDSIWTNRFKLDHFGEIKGETTVHGNKLAIRTGLKVKADILEDLIANESNWKRIKEKFVNYKPNKKVTNFYEGYELYIKEKKRKERYAYAEQLESALKQLKKFHPRENLTFFDITQEFLKDYEEHRIKLGIAKASIGVELRYIRAVLNKNMTPALKEQYPFGQDKFVIPEGKRRNQGLVESDIKKIFAYHSDNYLKQRARDLFIFSFLNGGMNFRDIVLLEKNHVEFTRAKSRFTAKKIVKIRLNKDPKFQAILEDICNRYKGKSKYLFNFLDDSDGELEILKKARYVVNKANEKLKQIKDELGIEENISTGWARHSNATILMAKGLDLKTISEGMGHTNLKTTEGYIDSLIDKNRNKVIDALDIFGDED